MEINTQRVEAKLPQIWRAFAKWCHNMRLLRKPLRQPQEESQPLSQPASRVSWRSILALNTDEFCRNTSIHGLKYINSRRLHTADRVFFGLALLAVLCFAAFLMQDAFEKWNTTPVIVGINPEPTYITNEPFPAITICNLNQALAAQAAHIVNDSGKFAMLQVLCRRRTNSQLARGNNNWEQLISNISQPCSAMVIGCRYGAVDSQCERLFHPIVTDEGLCCVFNMLHPRFMYKHNPPLTLRNISVERSYTPVNWNAELGYGRRLQDDPLNRYHPRASLGIGESLGLSLTLDVQADTYYCSSSSSIGFKLALHSPNESPNVRETGVLLAPGQETKMRIEPAKIITELHLRSVHRKYRHCLFRSEGNLSYFAHYTQRNCEMECMSRLLLQHCGCIVFYMPRLHGNDTVCSIRETQCVESVRLHAVGIAVESCLDNCLPSCFDLTFNAIPYSTKISYEDFRVANPAMRNLSQSYVERSIAVLNLYYKEQTFRANKQTEFIGISDFLSNVGGLMGLFLGFSFLSIAECIYFAFIRPCRICTEFREQRTVSTLELAKASSIVAPEELKAPKLHLNRQLTPNRLWQQQRQRERQLQQQRNLTHISTAAWFRTELGPQFSPA